MENFSQKDYDNFLKHASSIGEIVTWQVACKLLNEGKRILDVSKAGYARISEYGVPTYCYIKKNNRGSIVNEEGDVLFRTELAKSNMFIEIEPFDYEHYSNLIFENKKMGEILEDILGFSPDQITDAINGENPRKILSRQGRAFKEMLDLRHAHFSINGEIVIEAELADWDFDLDKKLNHLIIPSEELHKFAQVWKPCGTKMTMLFKENIEFSKQDDGSIKIIAKKF